MITFPSKQTHSLDGACYTVLPSSCPEVCSHPGRCRGAAVPRPPQGDSPSRPYTERCGSFYRALTTRT